MNFSNWKQEMIMHSLIARFKWHPTLPTIIAGVVVVAGFVLMEVSGWFLILAGIGTFGPGILRELGLLNDQDEFQRQAAHRAGYHAFLVTGLLAFIFVAGFRAQSQGASNIPEESVTTILALLWFVWFISSLLDYWGPQKTASRILIAFGIAWWVFSIADSLNSVISFVMASLVAVPFFLMAYLSKKWPMLSGILLIGFAAFFFYFFHLYEILGPDPMAKGRPVVIILFVGPLLASGVALLRMAKQSEDEDELERDISEAGVK